MIVSDKYRFIFIHIPKCGGTTLRNVLAPYDSTDGFFTGRIAELEGFGMVDHVHLPLDLISLKFPDIASKLDTYKSVALMRDPVERFGSALGQWLKNVKKERILELQPESIVTTATAILERVSELPQTLEPSLIHFRPQSDFIMLNGCRKVKRLYRMEELSQLGREIGNYAGVSFDDLGHANRAKLYRNDLLRMALEQGKPALMPFWKTLPAPIKSQLNRIIFKSPPNGKATLRATGQTVTEVFHTAGLTKKIEKLYFEDYPLLNQCVTSTHA